MGQFDTLLKQLRNDNFGEFLKMLGNGSQDPYLEVENRISNILKIKKQYILLLCECQAYMQNGLNATNNCYQTIELLSDILNEYDIAIKNKDKHNENKDDGLTYSINFERIQLFGHVVRMYHVSQHQVLSAKISNFLNLIGREAEVWMTIQERIIPVKLMCTHEL